VWPVVVFEADGWPIVVAGPDEVSAVSEEDFWDEVRIAFDSDFVAVVVAPNEGLHRRFIRTQGLPQPDAVGEHGRRALVQFDRKKFARWRKANPQRADEIARWNPRRVWSELTTQFGAG